MWAAVAVWRKADLAINGRRLLHWLVQSTIHLSNLRFCPVYGRKTKKFSLINIVFTKSKMKQIESVSRPGPYCGWICKEAPRLRKGLTKPGLLWSDSARAVTVAGGWGTKCMTTRRCHNHKCQTCCRCNFMIANKRSQRCPFFFWQVWLLHNTTLCCSRNIYA